MTPDSHIAPFHQTLDARQTTLHDIRRGLAMLGGKAAAAGLAGLANVIDEAALIAEENSRGKMRLLS